ncbi:hypothetical protein C8R47DRAFT_1230381 [Mycena vitilis]|nr:hypothetical protein C8R47DRAFT_1230381 [Mycena vitilis]
MTFTNIGVCPYLSPLVLVSSVGLAKQRAEATAFPMRVRRGPAITDDTFHNIANPGLGACVPSCHYIPALFVTTSDDNRLATARPRHRLPRRAIACSRDRRL